MEFEKEMIKYGHAILTSKYQGFAALAVSEKRHGYIPFRVGKKAIFPFYAGFVVPKKGKIAVP